MAVFDDLLGDPSGTTNLAEPDVRRLTRRARWMAERRAQPACVHRDVAQIRDRASEQATLARQIAEALQVRDVVHARVPLGSGTALCWPRWNCRRARTIKTGWPSITRRPLYAAELFRGRFRRGGDASGIAPFRWEEIGAVLTLTVRACRGNTSEL